MKDLSSGSISQNIIHMALPIAIGMTVQTIYYLVDLYFVGQLGSIALAGVNIAGNLTLCIIGLTQILSVGTVALISQAVGKKDQTGSNRVFNQAISISVFLGILTLFAGYYFADEYLQFISSDEATMVAGKTYLYWYMPNLALQFALVAMGSALRGTGIVKPTMIAQMVSIIVNIILSPILIKGWLIGKPMGVAGAGLASSLSILVAIAMMWHYFHRLEKYVKVSGREMKPHIGTWKKIISIGFPAGAELLLMFFNMAVIFWAINIFGPSAQAGFGLSSKIMQAIFIPALAIAFALPAIVGQNYGAKSINRITESFKKAAMMISVLMFFLTIIIMWNAALFLQAFTEDADALIIGVNFLQIIALNFIPTGIVFTCSGLLQGLGNTWPALYSMAIRVILFALPTIYLSQQASFKIEQLWYLSVTTVIIQSVISLLFVKKALRNMEKIQ